MVNRTKLYDTWTLNFLTEKAIRHRNLFLLFSIQKVTVSCFLAAVKVHLTLGISIFKTQQENSHDDSFVHQSAGWHLKQRQAFSGTRSSFRFRDCAHHGARLRTCVLVNAHNLRLWRSLPLLWKSVGKANRKTCNKIDFPEYWELYCRLFLFLVI